MPLLVGWSWVGVSSVAILLRVGVSLVGALLRVGVPLTLLATLSPSSSMRTSGLTTPGRAVLLWGRATVNPWESIFCCGGRCSNYVTAWQDMVRASTCEHVWQEHSIYTSLENRPK